MIGVAATAFWLRDFWSYDATTDAHLLAERARRADLGEAQI